MTRRRQEGVALLVVLTVLVLGVAWFAIGAGKSSMVSDYQREAKTGTALREAKAAVLAYAAQYAARTSTNEPGQMPCPESLNYYAAGTEGQASTSCSNANESVGRLPWRTLGIDQLRDGYGEPLWFVLSRGFRNPPINFGTPAQINYNGTANAAVALIIAPGRARDTSSDPGTPPAPCAKVNQRSTNRYSTASALDPTKYLECGNPATGPYGNPPNMTNWSAWSNDRVIAITAQEWADAIAPAVADRLQRQTLPALRNWDSAELAATGKSWASTWGISYQPYAVAFGNPTTSSFCGSLGVSEGLVPLAGWSTASCDIRWTGNTSALINLITLGCSQQLTYLRCQFLGLAAVAGATITATAPIANGYRSTLTASDVFVSNGGSVVGSSMTVDTTTSTMKFTVQVAYPLLGLLLPVEVQIPYVGDANVLSDSRVAWITNNNWHQYLYYAVAPGAQANPSGTCAAAGDPGCITVAGLPASTGNTNDKRLVLTLSGRPIGTQVQPSANRTDYFESRISATQFSASTVTSTFNDRLAACPFQFTMQSGATTAICN